VKSPGALYRKEEGRRIRIREDVTTVEVREKRNLEMLCFRL
jgi:hypothetical protein